MKTFNNAVIFIVAAVFTVSCKDMAKDMRAMLKLQDTLSKKYEIKEVNLNIMNGKVITVSLVNTKFNELQPEEKQKMAYEIGEIVLKTIGKDHKIESGHLIFEEANRHFVVSTTKSVSFDMRLDSLAKIIPVNDTIHRFN